MTKNKTPKKIICNLILMLFLKRVWLEGKTFFLCNTLIVKPDFVKNSFAVSVQHIVLVY